MINKILVASFCVFPATLFAQAILLDGFEAPSTQPPTGAPPKSVFFSGHSLLDNPTANYVEYIATQKNYPFQWNQQIIGGSPIRFRTAGDLFYEDIPATLDWGGYRDGKNKAGGEDLDIIAELKNPTTITSDQGYDALVITERHDIIGTTIAEWTRELLRHYHDRLRAGNPDAKTYLYQSWLYMDRNNPSQWINYERVSLTAWQCAADQVNRSLAADELPENIDVIPAGWALTYLVQAILDGDISGYTGTTAPEKLGHLFEEEGDKIVHLKHAGKYYIAGFVYAMLFGETPQGILSTPDAPINLGNDLVTDESIDQLLALAWSTYRDYMAHHASIPTPEDCNRIVHDQVCRAYAQQNDPLNRDLERQSLEENFCKNWTQDATVSYTATLEKWPAPPVE